MCCKHIVPFAASPEVRASGPIIATMPERIGSQGRPDRAERSELRSGALDGPGRGGYPADSDPRSNSGAAAFGQVYFEIAPAESQGTPDLEMGKPSGPGQVVDRRHRQAQKLRYFLGGEQLVIERDDRVAHDRLRIVDVPVDASGASSTIASAPTAQAARCTASAIGGAAW